MSKVTRLHGLFQPRHYDLHIKIDKVTLTFEGKVIITAFKKRPSKRITLHQLGLNITKAAITKLEKKQTVAQEVSRIQKHATYDEVRIHSANTLFPGEYVIELEFNGIISPQMNGMYPCNFEHDGQAKQLIATQFESHHAREVFPCIDEPEAKATFDLTLITDANETVVANTPVKSQEPIDHIDHENVKLQKTVFETTPLMSTYLLAWVTGDLLYKEATTQSGIKVRAYATPGNVGFTDFSLDLAVKTLDFYSQYFEVRYPLAKCDMIALPDFASGAMENWGCITYRESCMLVDPANTPLSSKQYVALVVAHELAHQWFGNLVTMRWWTDLWLNEGFASWVEFLAVDHLFPEWELWTQFMVDEQQSAMRLDALENTHPVEVEVKNPDEIRSIFDAISYHKGASVIHMLEQYLGAEIFRKGLVHYLKKHSYNNTDTVDLWSALEEVSGKPVKSFMHSWTSTPGFPIVQVSSDNQKLILEQERFLINRDTIDGKRTYNNTWPVPLLSTKSLSHDVFDKHRQIINVSTDNAPLKINIGQSGFYKTIYTPEIYAQIKPLIIAKELAPEDRLGILSDLFEASKAGYTSTVFALELLEAYNHENHLSVWDVMTFIFADIKRVMGDEEIREAMKPYMRKFVNGELQRLGWEEKPNEKHTDTLLRPIILGIAANSDQKLVVDEALNRFDSAKKPEDISPNSRSIVYGTAVRKGGRPEFEKLLGWYRTTKSADEKDTLGAALTGFEQPDIIGEVLNMTNSSDVRLQDVGYWIAYSFMNRHAKTATWHWMKEHWAWLSEYLGTDMAFSRMPVYAARVFSDADFLKEYDEFFETQSEGIPVRSIKQGHEQVAWQISWKRRDHAAILKFLQDQKY